MSPPRKVGIVVVAYGASTAVRITLASLRAARNDAASELVVVDNSRTADERDRIRRAVEHHARDGRLPWRYVGAERNLGFAGGNNLGVATFLADPAITHVCLLNSDVVVPHRWLDGLLASGRDVTSPVTNRAESEQCVPIDYTLSLEQCLDGECEALQPRAFDLVNRFAERRHRAFGGNVVDCDATFFCVLLSRQALERVGLLDEQFFPGGYEDDDWCLRARQCGIPVHLDRGVFVHHWGSASFGQLAFPERDETGLRNRARLEQKHGLRWKPRPEKPWVSFAQDVAFAATGRGDRTLQRRACAAYGRVLAPVLELLLRDATWLRTIVCTVEAMPAADVPPATEAAATHGGLTARWRALDRAAAARVRGAHTEQDVVRELLAFADAVHDLAVGNAALRAQLIARHLPGWPAPWRKGWWHRAWFAVRAGVPFVLGLRGIVFFGGYPYAIRESDGYFQRVRAIDDLFPDRWRIYHDPSPLPGQVTWWEQPAVRTIVLRPIADRLRVWVMHLVVRLLVARCRVVWFHSVLRMQDGGFARLLRWPFVKKVLDVHGAVPEEFRMLGDERNAALFERHEASAARAAHVLIVVSQAMRTHLMRKHGERLRGEVIVLPIFPALECHRDAKPIANGRPVVVYAGGLHKWQQVPKMIDAIVRTRTTCLHRFYCTDPDAVVKMLPAHALADGSVVVGRKTHEELLDCYREAHYGFVLREHSVVNRVACPTKLVEYLAMGIVPIVDSEAIGDFADLGMRSVALADFVAGRLPDAATRDAMARANFDVFGRLGAQRQAGAKRLRELIGPGLASRSLGARLLWNTAQLFPAGTWRGRAARKVWRLLPHRTPAEPERAAGELSKLEPCDVLVQVGNFTSGGLENVVLDLNETLRAAGLRVGMLVLGEAGAGVACARAQGVDVCTARYSEAAYRHWLQTAAPKVVVSHYSVDGAAVCGELRIPLVQVIHNTYLWVEGAELAAMQASAAHTTTFVAVSEFARAYAVTRLGVPDDKCITIPNGIDVRRFRGPELARERERLRTELGFGPDDFVFLNVGALNHQKNQISLLRAFRECAAACPQARLVIVGPRSEPHVVRECEDFVARHGLGGRVTFTGGVVDPHRYYAMADAFVHSAFFEGGQLSLLEALAANLPVVTVATGFAIHFAKCKGVTTVAPHFDVASYRGHITAMKASPATEREMAAAMQRVHHTRERPDLPAAVVESFDRATAYAIHVDLVQQLMNGGAGQPASIARAWSNCLEAAG